ncbi:MAG TPA: hypothetical protein EYP40_08130 [Chromatiales bacterium]|nr:hypothetical protein [Chromatiales bacterium]
MRPIVDTELQSEGCELVNRNQLHVTPDGEDIHWSCFGVTTSVDDSLLCLSANSVVGYYDWEDGRDWVSVRLMRECPE